MLSKEILSYVSDVNPNEIKAQIEAGNLKNFCNGLMERCSKALGVKGNPYEVITREDCGRVTTSEAAVIAKEFIEIIEKNKFRERRYPLFYRSFDADDVLDYTNVLDALGEPYGSNLVYKNRYSYHYIDSNLKIINYKAQIGPYPYGILNSAKHAEFKPGYYIVFESSIGRLMFVDKRNYDLVEDEWEEFMEKLISYNPVDYDYINTRIVFTVENGKRLAHDYKKIVDEISEKMDKKIKKKLLEEKKAELKRMQEELGDE